MRAAFLLAGAALAATGPAAARAPGGAYAPAALRAPLDARIRVLAYDADRVTALNLVFGFQTMLQFGADEHIENVSIGDGQAWQVTPNKAATLLFVKPVDIATRTNMTVVTDRRSYLFELSASRRGANEPPYVVRFTYPPEHPTGQVARPPAPPPPEQRNTAYSYTGSRAILPAVVFDDGRFTFFKWPENTATPALFAVAADGSESLVNYSVQGGYQVVEQVAPRFLLRNGKEVTAVINDGWREPQPPIGAPRPADAKTARAAARAAGHDGGARP